MDAVVTLGTTESIGNILHVATSACTGIAATELVGLGIAGLGLFALIPILLMALSMLWFKITGQDGWVIMIGAGLAWFALAAYGFATSSSSWDVYQIVASMSIAMACLCFLLSYSGRQTRQAAAKVKIEVEQESPKKATYAERFGEWEQDSGLKSKKEREDEEYKYRV